MADLAALATVARGLLPTTVALAVADPAWPLAAPLPEEALPKAVPSRQREFAAGRAAARAALSQLGQRAVAIPMGSDRAPVWPAGINGSITHSAALCLAAVTHAPRLIGVDLEPATGLDHDLWQTVLLPQERAALAGSPRAPQLAKLIFSAKEAAYKAQYARSKTLFGFDALLVTLAEKSFTACFTQSVPGFPAGSQLHGLYAETAGHYLTVVVH